MSITESAKAVRRFLLRPTQGPATILLIRLAVGLIFSTQGILKYIDPNMGVVRFTRIGFAHPYFTAHFVGTFEIACGLLVLFGLWTRAAAVPLLIVIMVAIATTKVPELFRINQGVWYLRERVWPSSVVRALDKGGGCSAVDCDYGCDCDHQGPGAISY